MTGPTLLEAIDTIEVADRVELERGKPFRFCVADVYKKYCRRFSRCRCRCVDVRMMRSLAAKNLDSPLAGVSKPARYNRQLVNLSCVALNDVDRVRRVRSIDRRRRRSRRVGDGRR